MGLFKRKNKKEPKNKVSKQNKVTKTKQVTTNKKTSKTNNKKAVSIGQTLETNDLYLPHKKYKKPQSKSRPVIVVDKTKNNEFMVVPASTQQTRNTKPYNKYGIKNYRNVIEIDDNEGNPITLNIKFQITSNSTKLPEEDALIIKDNVINHSRFASVNRKKEEEFEKRKKR